MNKRTVQTLITLTDRNNSTTDICSAALALALCRYVDISKVGLEPQQVTKAIAPYIDAIVRYAPLNLPVIKEFSYQLHQYRHSVANGYFPNTTPTCNTTWLFGMSTYMSSNLMLLLSSPDIMPLYRSLSSILLDLHTEANNAPNV